jgi:hypothetical protein
MVTKRQRVEAVRQILIQLYALVDQGMHKKNITRIEREAIFFLYEYPDLRKWDEIRPHSAAARRLRKAIEGRVKSKRDGITYDHAIPLATLRCHLKKATIFTEAMQRALERFVCGVIITTEENDRLSENHLRLQMPDGARPDDRLARYHAVGIKFDAADEIKLRSAGSHAAPD